MRRIFSPWKYRATLLVVIALVAAPAARAQDPVTSGRVFVRANLGVDVIGGGLGVGVGIGFRLPNGGDIVVDGFYIPYSEKYSEGYGSYIRDYEYESELSLLAVRYDFVSRGQRLGVFPVVGTGLFVAGFSWEERSLLRSGGSPINDGADVTTSGAILNLGLGYAFGPATEARLEAPILLFFAEEGRASRVAIPLSLSFGYRF
jgi:hypothetical protein